MIKSKTIKNIFLLLVFQISLNGFSQEIHNFYLNGLEYLNFEKKTPCFVCEYNFKNDEQVNNYGLYVEYDIHDVSNSVGHPLIYEFRNDTSFLFILGFMEHPYKIRVLDKLIIPFWKDHQHYCVSYGECEYKGVPSRSIFGFFEDKDTTNWLNRYNIQYFEHPSKVWEIEKVSYNKWRSSLRLYS